jgi:predicted small secreted protein
MKKSILVLVFFVVGLVLISSCTSHKGCAGMQVNQEVQKTDKPA